MGHAEENTMRYLDLLRKIEKERAEHGPAECTLYDGVNGHACWNLNTQIEWVHPRFGRCVGRVRQASHDGWVLVQGEYPPHRLVWIHERLLAADAP